MRKTLEFAHSGRLGKVTVAKAICYAVASNYTSGIAFDYDCKELGK